jgi:N-acetylmuramoyl-L-alanine amidase
MTKIVMSSGHGKYVRGASGLIDEVEEARRVVPRVAEFLRAHGHQVIEFHDNTSITQNENLDTIVNFHNSQDRDLDVSVHFNAYIPTDGARGTEVLYVTQEDLAGRIAAAISRAGHLVNRGAHYRTDLAFLNGTDEPAILIEVCFVDAASDVENYQNNFDAICAAIAGVGEAVRPSLVRFRGPCSWFGGPDDMGVAPDEGLAFIYDYDDAPYLFLDEQPPGTTGLARRLDPDVFYVACRWDYDVTPKDMLADPNLRALVRTADRAFLAWPADWGPHEDTGRAADLSPGLMQALDLMTDDGVEVIYPVPVTLRS